MWLVGFGLLLAAAAAIGYRLGKFIVDTSERVRSDAWG